MKRFIQICSLLSLLVLFTGFPSDASAGYGTEVEIPFAFQIGDRSHDAGQYIVKLERISASTSTLTLQNVKTDEMQTVLLNVSSAKAGSEMKLVFDTIEGKKYLTKVGTADKTYAIIHNNVDRKALKAREANRPSEGVVTGGGADLF